jgi:hypothetical protein
MECGIDPVDRVTDNGIPASAAPPLARLLPRLDATNLAAAGLDRARLYRLLTGMNAMSQPDVLKAILDLAVRLRDPDAYPYVKMFAMEAVAHHNSYRVREAARDVLPLLQDAMQKQRIGSKLLRAAGGPGGDQLLRAAHGATAAGGAELLRASDEAS